MGGTAGVILCLPLPLPAFRGGSVPPVGNLWKNQEDLGILVPIDGGFGLDTRRPVKRLGEGTLAFSLVSRHDTPKTRFEPIYPEEPYAYLQKRKDAYLAVKSAR